MIKFTSYNVHYPKLGSGILSLEIDGVIRTDFNLSSRGCIWVDMDGNKYIGHGCCAVDVSNDLDNYSMRAKIL